MRGEVCTAGDEPVDRLVSIAECLEMDGDCLFNGYSGTKCGKFLRELARKQVECEPAEWSEEDEKILERFLGWLQGTMGEKTYSLWLKSLRERFNLQPKQEWSEEDEKMLTDISWAIRYCAYDDKKKERMMKWFNDDYRKSLRPQPKVELTELDKIS